MMKKSLSFLLLFFFSLAVFAQDAAKLISQADSLAGLKKYAEAFDLYDKALTNLGQVKVKESINYTVATVAVNAGKNEAALAYLDKAIAAAVDTSFKIDLVKCYQYKGLVYARLKDFNNSLASYERAIEISPDKPGALYFNAALIAFNLEKYEKAIEYSDKSFAAGVKPEEALLNKANSYNKLKNDSLYLQTLQTGFEKFPANKNFSGRLAAISYTEGSKLYKSGLDILNATIKKVNDKKLKQEDAEYKNSIAKVNDLYAKAVVQLKKALEYDPANANAQKLIDACKPVK
jgi:tetratricopeptide (TPR) repeat protein